MSEETVVKITSIPVHSFMEGPLPGLRGSTVSYSNHELGIKEVVLETPLMFTIGDKDAEALAIYTMSRVAEIVSEAVQMVFWSQLDRLAEEIKSRGGYRPKLETPDSL